MANKVQPEQQTKEPNPFIFGFVGLVLAGAFMGLLYLTGILGGSVFGDFSTWTVNAPEGIDAKVLVSLPQDQFTDSKAVSDLFGLDVAQGIKVYTQDEKIMAKVKVVLLPVFPGFYEKSIYEEIYNDDEELRIATTDSQKDFAKDVVVTNKFKIDEDTYRVEYDLTSKSKLDGEADTAYKAIHVTKFSKDYSFTIVVDAEKELFENNLDVFEKIIASLSLEANGSPFDQEQ